MISKTPTAATSQLLWAYLRQSQRITAMGVGDPSKSVAARFQRLVGAGGAAQGRVANTANAIKQQSQLFMQGITGANNATVLSTAGRPFPNVARGAGAHLEMKQVVSSVLVEVLELVFKTLLLVRHGI